MGLLFAGMLFCSAVIYCSAGGESVLHSRGGTNACFRREFRRQRAARDPQHKPPRGKTPRVKVTNVLHAVIVILGLVDATGIVYCLTLMRVL